MSLNTPVAHTLLKVRLGEWENHCDTERAILVAIQKPRNASALGSR